TVTVPDADIPTERTSLLPQTGPVTRPDTWRQVGLTILAVIEVTGWTVALIRRATNLPASNGVGILGLVTTAVALASWVYAALRPTLHPSRTPYYDLLTLYFTHFLAAGVSLYEASIASSNNAFTLSHLGRVVDSILTLAGIVMVVDMPLSITGKPESDEEGLLPSLEDHCTLWQWITFTWVSPIISLGALQPLEEKDVWQLSKIMRTRVLMRKFLQVKRSSLVRRILAANAMDLFLDGSLTVVSTLMNFSAPFFLNLTLRAMRDPVSTNSASITTASFSENLRFYSAVALDSAFLPTLLRTSTSDTFSTATVTGAPRTLQRSDAYFFAIAACVCQIIKSQSDLQHLYFSRRASVRVKGELVASVYEKALKRKDVTGAVQKDKEKDVKGKGKEAEGAPPQDSSSADVGKIVSLIAADSDRVSRFVSLGPFIYDAPISIIVACSMLYNLMGWTAFAGYVAMLFALPINTIIVRRTSSFQRSVSAMRDRRMRAMNEAIQSIKFIKFSAWESRWILRVLDARQAELKWLRKLKISFFFLGMMWDIVPILSSWVDGKVLAALLGEMDRLEGEVYLPKEPTRLNEKTGLPLTISYCAQQPWLEHKSIKDNILFGSPFDKERYEATLNCCALLPDLAILEDGDETEIGEKGVSLSGGQKARVALARAVYARTQVVLMDDVLSAVDSHTAEQIVKRCFLGPIMKHRTVVLVTHHVDLVLPTVSWVVKLHEGQIEAQGTVEQLRESGALAMTRAGQKGIEITEEASAAEGEIQPTGPKDPNKTTRKLVDEEKKSTGTVKLKVYKTYLSAASYWIFGILVSFLAIDQLTQLLQKFWIKRWSESYDEQPSVMHIAKEWLDFGLPSARDNVLPYLLIYIGIQGVISAVNILNQTPSIMSTLRASRLLYEKMLRSVMRSPSRFFDKTPSGRILNRFSKDIDTIDGGLQDFMIQVIMQIISLAVAVGTIVYAVPFFIVPAFVIAYVHLWFARGYVNASRDLRRIESNTRSPIISSFGELVVGIVTVRAFGTEKTFLNSLYKRLDRTQAATHYYWMCNRWLLFRFDSLGAVSVLIATTGSLLGGAEAGLAGIVIVQAQQYVRGLYWGLRFWTELEQSLNSVERVQEYLDLPSEPPAVIETSRPPAAWPSASKGTLVVEDLVLKYAPELEPVLNGVSFETKPSEKIGIVGRTGSGKSTLALSLFRFVDPTAGKIVLDGIDITTIGLDDLRSRLTLIPQDAVLFNGTIRENLDPFNEYTDAEILEALQRVHLRTSDSPGRSLATSRAASIKDGITTPLVAGVVEPEDAGRDGAQAAITVPEDPSTDDSETLVPTAA
ncbi:hypothetical protein FRC07_005246, partial [Ceratobasidium sp. 392]